MKRLTSALCIAVSCVLAASTNALAAAPHPLLVSHGDPFASCLVGGNGSGLNYQSAEVEPWIAANPANTSNVVASWQQDRWSDGGAKGQVAAWSFNAGRTWGQTPQPFTRCAQPFYSTTVLQYDRASDPWQSFGPDGTAYAVSLIFDGDSIRNGLGAAVSHDGGRTWVHQQDIDPLVARADTLNPSDDKESVTAHPTIAGTAFAVWDHLQDVFPPCPAAAAPRAASVLGHDRSHPLARAAATAAAAPCPGVFTGPTALSRTTDGGKTWEKPRVIVATGPNEQTIGNEIVINAKTGTVYDFFNFIKSDGTNNIEMVYSNDLGLTWSHRQYVQRLFTTEEKRTGPAPTDCACGVIYPGDATKPLRTGDIIPEVAIDPSSGRLYVIWQDGRPTHFQNDVLLASTSPTGLTGTWSKPVEVNPERSKAAFTPGIAVNARGQVAVTYYDLTPPLTSPDILLTDTWFTVTSGPGLDFESRRLIGGPYNMEAAPVARGFFVGDYMSIAARVAAQRGDDGGRNGDDNQANGGFVPIFVMTNCADTSCTAQGTLDGSVAGPDSTDTFTSLGLGR